MFSLTFWQFVKKLSNKYSVSKGPPLASGWNCSQFTPSRFLVESLRNFSKIAFEAYPALIAKLITKDSYKSDDKKKQNTAQLNSRKLILSALVNDEAKLSLKLLVSQEMSEIVLKDGQGDFLDAVICMLKVSSSILKPNFGLPQKIDPLEGWILCS